jgi:hypothetical protein
LGGTPEPNAVPERTPIPAKPVHQCALPDIKRHVLRVECQRCPALVISAFYRDVQ